MRKRRLMEYINDYDFLIRYFLKKDNVVANALSKKIVTLAVMTDERMLMEQFRDLNLDVQPSGETMLLTNMFAFEPIVISRIKENQRNDMKIAKIFEQIAKRSRFEVVDSILYFRGRLWVPDIDGLQDEIMMEAYHTRYLIHLASTKMIQNLKDRYWWKNMKGR